MNMYAYLTNYQSLVQQNRKSLAGHIYPCFHMAREKLHSSETYWSSPARWQRHPLLLVLKTRNIHFFQIFPTCIVKLTDAKWRRIARFSCQLCNFVVFVFAYQKSSFWSFSKKYCFHFVLYKCVKINIICSTNICMLTNWGTQNCLTIYTFHICVYIRCTRA